MLGICLACAWRVPHTSDLKSDPETLYKQTLPSNLHSLSFLNSANLSHLFTMASRNLAAASAARAVPRPSGARPSRLAATVINAPSFGDGFLSAEGYAASFEPALKLVKADNSVAILKVFDIDDTLNKSSGTGSRGQLPADVLDGLKALQAQDNIFVMAATGRTPEDAQKAFGDFEVPLVARDGSWVRFPDGEVVEFPFPPVPEFESLAGHIVERKDISASQLTELLPAIGLSFPLTDTGLAAFNYYVPVFQRAAEQRNGELVVYTHYYPSKCKEIILQNGLHTKATGILKMVSWLRESYGFKQVLVFAHGNSSNDLGMIKLANQMRAVQGLGGSFWVGGDSKIAMGSFEKVEDLQQGIIALASRVGGAA